MTTNARTHERTSARIGIRHIAVIIALAVAAGCAKGPARTAFSEGGVRTAKAAALEDRLARYAQETASIKALAWFDLSGGDEERQTDAAVVIARPASIRANAMDALADVWAQAGSDGSRLWLFLPAKNKLYSGRASAANLRRLMHTDWEVAELLSVIAGSPPLAGAPELVQMSPLRDNHFAVRGGDLHLWTDGKGTLLKCARYRGEGEPLDAVVTFSDYRRVNGVEFPHRIEATFPERGARITVVYRDVQLGGRIDRALFLAPARGRAVELRDEKS